MALTRVLVSALQVAPEFSGIGRRALSLGEELHRLPEEVEIELRCAADSCELLRPAFPARTRLRSPLRHSRPRAARIAYEQAMAPARDPSSALVVCLGDQAPLWGPARVFLVVNDVRRMVRPESSGLDGRYYRFMVPRAVRRASMVVTVSEFSRREIFRVLGVDARVVADHPQPQVDEPLGGAANGHYAVVGALRPYKRVETAIGALALLPDGARRELVFAGSDEGRRDELLGLARELGVGDLVRVLGWVDESRLREVYEGALATLSTSTYEGYGLPVAESLSYGLPTIASDLPPHRETAGDAALYFPAEDARALAECMRRVVEDAELRGRLSVGALERSRELSRANSRWADFILEALGRE
jgi:glycosyltransferase involved in cell wall biosynthesis